MLLRVSCSISCQPTPSLLEPQPRCIKGGTRGPKQQRHHGCLPGWTLQLSPRFRHRPLLPGTRRRCPLLRVAAKRSTRDEARESACHRERTTNLQHPVTEHEGWMGLAGGWKGHATSGHKSMTSSPLPRNPKTAFRTQWRDLPVHPSRDTEWKKSQATWSKPPTHTAIPFTAASSLPPAAPAPLCLKGNALSRALKGPFSEACPPLPPGASPSSRQSPSCP